MSKGIATPFGLKLAMPKTGGEFTVKMFDEVHELRKEYLDMRTPEPSMDFIERLVKVGKTLLGPNPVSYLSSIYENCSLIVEDDYNYDFLQDTVCFIVSGNRPMGINARSQLVELHTVDDTIVCPLLKAKPLGSTRRMERSEISGESVYTRWLSQTNGVYDMLCTLCVLFGKPN